MIALFLFCFLLGFSFLNKTYLYAIPANHASQPCLEDNQRTAFVLWHGMGDSCCSSGMNQLKSLLESHVTCPFVYSIRIGKDMNEDQRQGFLGNIHMQLESVCKELVQVPQLKHGFNAIGLSQGGLLLRALIQQCHNLTVHSLITFGSPHQGITDLPATFCSEHTFMCKWIKYLIATSVYSPTVQRSVVQAAYYKDIKNLEKYYKGNTFLPGINNEKTKDMIFFHRMNQLKKMVLVMHENDTILIPKSSAWFFNFNESLELDFTSTEMYTTNVLALRDLYSSGRLHFIKLPGDHLQFDETDFLNVVLPNIVTNHPISSFNTSSSKPLLILQT